MLIENGSLTRKTLAGQVAVVTGAGRGIGFEAARALIWLGAHVVIAEIDRSAGKDAAARLAREWGEGTVTFIQTDVGDERSVAKLANQTLRSHGHVDAVLNNATIAPLGAVKDTPIRDWDRSYRVNLRGPVLLARAFLPGMLTQNSGVFVCVSSVGTAYMGAYETFKAAQVHLSNTLAAELADTGVIAFTVGPGFVPTQTALSAVPRLAGMMGISVAELQATVKDTTISVEAAGAGFAAAIALAERYRGQEIASIQALHDAGIDLPAEQREVPSASLDHTELEGALALCRSIRSTLATQSEAWKEHSVFERQWLIRTFRSRAGMPVEVWLETLERLERCLEAGDLSTLPTIRAPLGALASYYGYLHEMARGYIKDPTKREEQLSTVQSWREAVEELNALLNR